MRTPQHLYIHVPFCASKCRYCAFYSVANAPPDFIAEYPRLLRRELELRKLSAVRFKTIYIGGGTPSLPGAALLDAIPRAPESELTLECNPADITPAFADAIAARGVTRVSIGAQSFDDETLRFLGRRHDSAATPVAVSALRRAGIGNISLDLIAAVPGCGKFMQSLERAVALAPGHISAYPLSVEPGSQFHGLGIAPVSDDIMMDELATAENFLAEHGYERYEISNYCKSETCKCRHNLAVWRGEDYAAAGPSAASRIGLERRTNAPDAQAWAESLRNGLLPAGKTETLTPEEDEKERFITRLRLSEGIRPEGERLKICERLTRTALMRPTRAGVYTLTQRGREVADAIAAEF